MDKNYLIKDPTKCWHLGDGAYVTIESDDSIIIWCERENGINWVGLSNAEIISLNLILERKNGRN